MVTYIKSLNKNPVTWDVDASFWMLVLMLAAKAHAVLYPE